MEAYYYGARFSTPIWPFPRFTFTVSGKVQSITPGTQVALGVARSFSTTGGNTPRWDVDTVTGFAEYPTETTISKTFTHTIDTPGKTLVGQYVIATFMPVLIVRSATGELQVATLDDASMIVDRYMPAMTEIILANRTFPANSQAGWTRFPYVSGMSAELSFAGGYARMAPTDPYSIHSYVINEDKLNNHVSWVAGQRLRITWKSWCNDPTAFSYITTYGTAAVMAMTVPGEALGGNPGWASATHRGDYTEYEYWIEMPTDSATADAYIGVLMKCSVGSEVRFGDLRVWITNAVEP